MYPVVGFYLLVVEGPVDLVIITSACIVTGHWATIGYIKGPPCKGLR